MPANKKKEQRNPDQDAALAAAFLTGDLPEADRRVQEEWVLRGDGTWEYYRDGQKTTPPDDLEPPR